VLAGLYLFGSLVAGDFDVGVSDVDLIAVLTSDPSDDLVARLGRMHDALASENPVWAGRIEVVYVSAAALSRWWEGIARLAVISPGEPFHVVEGGPDCGCSRAGSAIVTLCPRRRTRSSPCVVVVHAVRG